MGPLFYCGDFVMGFIQVMIIGSTYNSKVFCIFCSKLIFQTICFIMRAAMLSGQGRGSIEYSKHHGNYSIFATIFDLRGKGGKLKLYF